MLTHANAIGDRRDAHQVARTSAPEDDSLAYLPMAWVGDSVYTLVAEPRWSASAPTARRARRRCSATCASWAPPRVLAPPRIWENMLTGVQVRAADAAAAQALGVRALPRGRRAGRDPARRTASRCRWACGWRTRSASSSSTARCATSSGCGAPGGRYTGGAPLGPGHLPLLPLDRRQPQAGLRLHRDRPGWSRCSPTPRPIPTTAGPAVPGHRGQDRRPRRGAGQRRAASSRATSRTRRPRARSSTPTAGSTPATPASSTRAATWSSSTAPRTWARCADGTAFAPQFIENKLKFSPYIREAVAFGNERPFVTAMIAIDLNTVGNWAERRGLAYTSLHGPLARSRRSRELIREEIRQGQRDPAGGAARSGASCC